MAQPFSVIRNNYYRKKDLKSMKHTKHKMDKNSSISSTGFGNTSNQIPPAKHWCFTLNNYNEDDINVFQNTDSSIVPRYVFQEEVGESGTPHLQGYLYFKEKKRPIGFFKNKLSKAAHWEKTKKIKNSIKYCSEISKRAEGGQCFVRGIELPEPKYTIDLKLYNWQKVVTTWLQGPPCDRTIYYILGRDGKEGKTTFCKWLYLNYKRVFSISGSASDMKNGIITYLKDQGKLPEIILINIPRCKNNIISWAGVEEIKDMFFYSGKYEGGMVCGPSPHLIIFSNHEADWSKMSQDRWKVYELGQDRNMEELSIDGMWSVDEEHESWKLNKNTLQRLRGAHPRQTVGFIRELQSESQRGSELL